MGAFGIFAIGLTVVYVIYYTVQICIDLYSKPKNETVASVESFDIEGMAIEESKTVEETEGGFRVAKDGTDNGWNETTLHSTDNTSQETTQDEPKLDASGAPVTPAQEKITNAKDSMEEIAIGMSGELASQIMHSALTTGKPPVQIKKEIAKPTDNETNEGKGYDRI